MFPPFDTHELRRRHGTLHIQATTRELRAPPNPHKPVGYSTPLFLRDALSNPHDISNFLLPHFHVSIEYGIVKLLIKSRFTTLHFLLVEKL